MVIFFFFLKAKQVCDKAIEDTNLLIKISFLQSLS